MSTEFRALSKVRGKIRREIATVEDSEWEGGEINLVPYLDIVVNTVIFLLATTTSALSLANINVNSPRYEEPAAGAAAMPQDDDKPKLNLTVAVSYSGFILGGAGGTMTGADGQLPTIKCSTALQNERCPVYLTTLVGKDGKKEPGWVDKYDYAALTKMLTDIKKQYVGERQAILTADRFIPYKVVVQTMDTLRGKSTEKCTGTDGCLFDEVILSAGVQ